MPPRTTQQSHRPRVRESQIEPWLAYSLEASDATERRGCANLEVSMESNKAPANHSRDRSQGLDVRENPLSTAERYFSLDVPFYRTHGKPSEKERRPALGDPRSLTANVRAPRRMRPG